MTETRGVGGVRRGNRRWTFAGCTFDEAGWVLTVNGRRVMLESKPLELLRELLLRPGTAISKAELLDAIWPDVSVVEASLPTAIGKLRRVLKDGRRGRRIVETVPRIGYRLAVPVHVEDAFGASIANRPLATPGKNLPNALPVAALAESFSPRYRLPLRMMSVGGGMAILLAATVGVLGPSQNVRATQTAATANTTPRFTQKDAQKAIRRLDVGAIERMIAAGWDPSRQWDKEGNDALGVLLNHCEWDRGHDRRQMLLMARTLIEGGAPIDRRNIWGDTAYSIAKAPRYCGPDHPVTQMLEAICYGGTMGPRDRCLATYELNSAQRREQGLPPKA